MDFVIAMSALMVDQSQLDLSTLSAEIEGIRGLETRKYYQAMRRAMDRSVDYVEYINSPLDVQTALMSVAVNPPMEAALHTVMVEPIPAERVSVIEPVDIPEIVDDSIVEEVPIEIVEEVPIEEKDANEFNVCWQSLDEITDGTWYSADTLSVDTNKWHTDIPEGQNDPIEVESMQRKSGMNFLYRNDYMIERLLRRWHSDWHGDRPLLMVHTPHVTVHGKGQPY